MEQTRFHRKRRGIWGCAVMVYVVSAVFLLVQAAEIQWIDCKTLTVEGKGFADTESFYDRLPARAKEIVDTKVWSLSQNSAGVTVRFTTSATSISARWTLRKDVNMVHMPKTGSSGLDLYIKRDGKWHWVGMGKPATFPVCEANLTTVSAPGTNEFMLYLPLYNGVDKVEIGVPPGVQVSAAAPRGKPVVFYGSSILQGGCASRTGMAFPAILGRWMDRPIINMGFSGNGKMQPEVVEFLAGIDAEAYVIDSMPNMGALAGSGEVTSRTVALVNRLRLAHPQVPIFLVEENPRAGEFAFSSAPVNRQTNIELRAAYDQLIQAGVKGLHLISREWLVGTDGEATVDGQHLNDIGMIRTAEGLLPRLESVLSGSK